jgi:hypothetical protein
VETLGEAAPADPGGKGDFGAATEQIHQMLLIRTIQLCLDGCSHASFAQPCQFSACLNTLCWSCVTAIAQNYI